MTGILCEPRAKAQFLDSPTSSLTFDPMSASDRSWTVAPSLLWFAAFLIAGLVWEDGGLRALADRLTEHRDAAAPGPVPAVGQGAPQVADRSDASDDTTPAAPPRDAGDHGIGALDDPCIDGATELNGACKRWAMDAFYAAVGKSRAGTLGHPVRVSWFGDSVIATDAIPGRLRTRLQRELGDGGPGFVYVVPPHRFCANDAITRSSSGAWQSVAISIGPVTDGLYGPGGASAETDGGRATIKLASGTVSRVELYYLSAPHGGKASVLADGKPVIDVDTKADAKQPGWATAAIDAGASKLEVRGDGRVRLFGLDLENARGAVVDNLGIVSVHVKSFARNDAAHWSGELAHRGADLVMIMIGANEAEWLAPGDKDTKDYQAHYEAVLAPIRAGRPEASCLVVSPTDQAEAKDGGYPSRPVMPLLVDAQRKAALAKGCAFFSTYAWMGGKGSAAKWFKRRLVGTDFQHLTSDGANKLADAVYDALIEGAKRHAPT